VPLEHWFRNDLREMVSDLLLGRTATERGLFDTGLVHTMLDQHVQGVAPWHDQLWNLLMLEQWFRTFIDRRPGPGQAAESMTPSHASA
jgi:asparagine synthase (glutamine-hydrolysing)